MNNGARQIVQCLVRPVAVIEIPSDKLQEVHDSIRATCNAEPLLPQFSSNIKYVCLAMQHFVHAHKLAKEGSRTLYNGVPGRLLNGEPHTQIAWSEADSEAAEILEQGPLCVIYVPDLFYESEMAIEIAVADNSNDCWHLNGL